MTRSFFLPVLLIALFTGLFAPLLSRGQEGAKEKDYLEFYYENPRPEHFVRQMKDWAADGTLENEHARPALIAFISQVIRGNREKLEGWFDELAGLSPVQKQVFFTGMLYSRTTEAETLLKDTFGEVYEQQKEQTEKILEMPLDKKLTLDMLWGFYYATGSEHAIRRIVLCFRFIDAPTNPEGVDVPKGFAPLYKQLPHFAFGSLAGNASRHPRLVAILEAMLKEDDSLLKAEKEGIYDVLSEVKPETYPPVDRGNKA